VLDTLHTEIGAAEAEIDALKDLQGQGTVEP
jgi:hypothetical protein